MADVAGDDRARALIEAVVHGARRLGQRTIGEGVGDGGTLRPLRECGVDMAQGRFVGAPLPA